MAKGGKGAKKAATSAATKECKCEHPFNCDCGNRPERPSRGHKWDSETQTWGGKGHKQKGASGQIAQKSQEAKTTTVGKTTISQWQKLPSQLLADVCRKEKRPPAKYKKLDDRKGGQGSTYLYRVIVQDAKVTKRGGDSDLIYIPATGAPNDEQGKEESALLALLHMTPSLPHERVLPEPYKTTWLHALEASKHTKSKPPKGALTDKNTEDPPNKPASMPSDPHRNNRSGGGASVNTNLTMTKGYASLSEKKKIMEEQKKERNAKVRRHEAMRLANRDHQVFLSAASRKRIETLLRGDSSNAALLLNGLNSDLIDTEDTSENDDDDVKSLYVLERLGHEGFTRTQARASLKHYLASSPLSETDNANDEQMDVVYEECLQWLCIHLDESQLPEGFDPRGRTLDVVVPTKPVATPVITSSTCGKQQSTQATPKQKETDVDEQEVSNLMHLYGLSKSEALQATSFFSSQPSLSETERNTAESLLWSAFWQVSQVEAVSDLDQDVSMEERETNLELAAQELETLQAIFSPDELTVSHVSSNKGNQTVLNICVPQLDHDNETLSPSQTPKLEITLEDGLYPSVLPKYAFIKGGWKIPGLGTTLHIELVKFVGTDLTKGDVMVYELFSHAQGLLQTAQDGQLSPSPNNPLLPFLGKLASSRGYTNHGSDGDAGGPAAKSTANSSQNNNLKQKRKSRVSATRKRVVRPRVKSFFWSKRPQETLHATPFPKTNVLMQMARRNLPAAKARGEFLRVMHQAEQGGRVVLVTGETGCGKTTQIPQFILEEAPADAKIVVAQPRRLAATGVAGRVADERGERNPGEDSVGYVVRGDNAMCNNTRLMFCTTGVLLRQLQSEGALDCITHVVVDEVHERHLDTDVLLGVLKESLATNPHLRVVLMSATMDADRFAAYWGNNTPRMHIPGFTHPVEDYTLADVLSITGYIPRKKGKKKKFYGKGNYMGKKKASPWADSEKSDEEDTNDEEESIDPSIGSSTTASQGTNPQGHCIPIDELVKRVNESEIDYDLIASLVRHLVQTRCRDDDGSILCFLPGAPEIAKAEEAIRRIARNLSMNLLPLHGGLQPKDQQLIFRKSSAGVTKVILSTNVAETSITIPDCTVVIDTCKEKQSSYDPINRMPLLVERFASRDSLMQRRGRAGRVRPGTCYKLISQATFQKLPEHGEPEIRRCALDQTLLSLMFLGVENGTGNFLGKMLDPPTDQSVRAAIFSLQKLGAIMADSSVEGSLKLTPLGMHLAGIPAPPTVGKILVMGCLLGCRSAALAMAAGMSVGRSPFLKIDTFKTQRQKHREDEDIEKSIEEEKQRKVLEERAALFKTVGNSDHSILASVYMQWQSVPPGGGGKKKFCESLGLNFNGMRDMNQLVNQLSSSLATAGFVDTRESDMNANSWRIIRTCAVSALAPSQLVRVERPSTKYAETAEGAVEKDGVARELKFYIRGDESASNGGFVNKRYNGVPEERVFIHPSSANFTVGNYSCPWLVYHDLVRTSKSFLRDATECSSYALLLFGGMLEVQASNGLVIIDKYIRLAANARIGSLIGGLRKKVDDLLSKKVADPTVDIASSVEMKIIVNLLMSDGLGQ